MVAKVFVEAATESRALSCQQQDALAVRGPPIGRPSGWAKTRSSSFHSEPAGQHALADMGGLVPMEFGDERLRERPGCAGCAVS